MASQLHTYTARVSWSGGREGAGSITNDNSGQGFELRVPPEFGGPGGALNPEELLTDAIAGCYSITYGIVAGNRRIPFKNVEVEAVGTVDQNGANFVYKSIALSPKITLGAEATDQDIATAIDMAHKADAYCIVTNAVRGKVEVSISPSVQREGQAAEQTKPVSGDQSLNAPFAAPSATTAGAATAPAATSTTMPDNNSNASTPGADTAPNPNLSYEGSAETADQYGGAKEAEKPGSATATSGTDSQQGQSGQAQSGSSSAASAGAGSEVGAESQKQAGGGTGGGVNPANSEADDVSATSRQTGNPDSMEVGAVPG